MKHRSAAIAVVIAAFLGSQSAAAENELPVGKFGLNGGYRQNLGELGESYPWGWYLGFNAGYQPSPTGQSYSLGVDWSVLWGFFGPDDPTIVENSLKVLEMSFGFRFRYLLGKVTPHFIATSAGVSLLRTNLPVAPDMDRLYLGPYAGLGYEIYFLGDYLLSVDGRYGMFAGGPPSFSLTFGVSFGSR